MAADGRLYFSAEDGTIHVIKAGPEFEVLARNKMDDVCLSTPAISDKTIFIRTSKHLYAISGDEKVAESGSSKAPEKAAESASTESTTPAASAAPAGEMTDPLEILKRADAACKAVTAVNYETTVEGTDALTRYVGKMKARISAAGYLGSGPEKYRIEAEMILPGSTELQKAVGGCDGDKYYLIDHETKTVHQDLERRVMGSYARPLQFTMMNELLLPEPYTEELGNATLDLKGSKTIGDEDCYEIYIVYNETPSPKSSWYFSKRDFLPRARIDDYTLQDGSTGQLRHIVTKLECNPKLADDAFKLTVPQGYQKKDTPAP